MLNKSERILSRRASPLPLKALAWKALVFTLKCGKSNPLSFALRPLVTHKHLRTGVGVYMAGLAIMVACLRPLPLQADNIGGLPTVMVAPEGEVKLATNRGTQVPLANYAVSQKYWALHPGLDMSARLGEPIRPISNGKVILAEKSWFGYGNLVVITHGVEYESWYAHLSKINVVVGQDVTQQTIIGEVGSTGRSTGPHLHLEVHENGVTVNPATVLGIKNQSTVSLVD